jgi:hypothetical protein
MTATEEQMKNIYDKVKADLQIQFDATLKDLQTKVTQLSGGGGSGGVGGNGIEVTPKFNYKSFSRMEKFTGIANEWSGWMFNLKVCVDAMDNDFGDAVHQVMQIKLDKENSIALKEAMHTVEWNSDPFMLNRKFFEVLCGITTGEANIIVRSTVEKFGNCGFGALYLLNKRYRPNTHARRIQCLTEVVRPPIIKDSRQLVMAVELWEGKVASLFRDFQQDLGDGIKTAILISMIPREYQDMVFQLGVGDKDPDYTEIRDKVMSVAGNRVQMATPTPMDVGQIGQEDNYGSEWFGGEGCDEHATDYGAHGSEVMAVGKGSGKCFRCGGSGHMARDCATPADKGKGKGGGGFKGNGGGGYSTKGSKGFDGGKGYGKANYNSYGGIYGSGPKGGGKGKGYQGECWRCGKVGHKAAECTVMIQEVEDNQNEKVVEQVTIGSVWNIACVEVKDDRDELLEVPPGLTTEKADEETSGWTIKKNKRQKRRYTPFKPMDKIVEEPVADICAIGCQTQITVDSGAEVSVCPPEWGEHFGLIKDHKMKLNTASGAAIPYHGSREAVFKTTVTSGNKSAEEKLMSMGFEVCEVKKALAAVVKICEKGNLVQFGFLDGESFIKNKKTGEKVFMKRQGGSYVLDIEFCDSSF